MKYPHIKNHHGHLYEVGLFKFKCHTDTAIAEALVASFDLEQEITVYFGDCFSGEATGKELSGRIHCSVLNDFPVILEGGCTMVTRFEAEDIVLITNSDGNVLYQHEGFKQQLQVRAA